MEGHQLFEDVRPTFVVRHSETPEPFPPVIDSPCQELHVSSQLAKLLDKLEKVAGKVASASSELASLTNEMKSLQQQIYRSGNERESTYLFREDEKGISDWSEAAEEDNEEGKEEECRILPPATTPSREASLGGGEEEIRTSPATTPLRESSQGRGGGIRTSPATTPLREPSLGERLSLHSDANESVPLLARLDCQPTGIKRGRDLSEGDFQDAERYQDNSRDWFPTLPKQRRLGGDSWYSEEDVHAIPTSPDKVQNSARLAPSYQDYELSSVANTRFASRLIPFVNELQRMIRNRGQWPRVSSISRFPKQLLRSSDQSAKIYFTFIKFLVYAQTCLDLQLRLDDANIELLIGFGNVEKPWLSQDRAVTVTWEHQINPFIILQETRFRPPNMDWAISQFKRSPSQFYPFAAAILQSPSALAIVHTSQLKEILLLSDPDILAKSNIASFQVYLACAAQYCNMTTTKDIDGWIVTIQFNSPHRPFILPQHNKDFFRNRSYLLAPQ